ncbi:hypothetical protein [Natronorubrum daqingense]|uniref:Uncharacterized protein n=1 Tax=Natronorubrum daqingense TaxID=588898 RepID=A0A1N6ZAR3_9EURY|nr:hypothetical protein [Natronorubrum daqingense]APX95405.1 hypothetical protein BB347_01570 [Natronorubrum daqingense]SIR23970.1 hypothetical protein SAMN05421809_0742 [Natronorubrum daqingense]
MTRETYSRREQLQALGAVGALVGGSAIGLSSVSADDDTDDTEETDDTNGDDDPEGDATGDDQPEENGAADRLSLIPKCIDEAHGSAAFCVVNRGKRDADLEWRLETPKEDEKEPDEPDEPDEPEAGIEYLDCQTIRVVGDFAEVSFEALFVENGEIGNVIEFVGPVEGEQTIDITEVETVPEDAIVGYAEAFHDDGEPVPGDGDVTAINPELEACQEAFLGEVVVEGSEDDGDETPADDEAAASEEASSSVESADESALECEQGELVVPAKSTACFPVPTTDGSASVVVLEDGQEVDSASIDAETGEACPCPVYPDPDAEFPFENPEEA